MILYLSDATILSIFTTVGIWLVVLGGIGLVFRWRIAKYLLTGILGYVSFRVFAPLGAEAYVRAQEIAAEARVEKQYYQSSITEVGPGQ